mgnify:CR=1 FL=1
MTTVKVNTLDTIRYPANETDSGYDIIAASDPFIQGIAIDKTDDYLAIDYIEYDTNLIIEPQDGYYACVFPRSSISKYATRFGLPYNTAAVVVKIAKQALDIYTLGQLRRRMGERRRHDACAAAATRAATVASARAWWWWWWWWW